MSTAMETAGERLPREVTIAGKTVTIRKMAKSDAGAMLAFARALPEHDLLFLMRDITQPEVIDRWLTLVDEGEMSAIVAEQDGRLIGSTTVIPSDEPWSAHVGELRVIVSTEARGTGLGTRLAQEAFALALELGLERMIARMTTDQTGAIAAFEGLGFKAEGVLRDHVIDQAGQKHDLLVMGHDVHRFQGTLAAYGVTDALA